MLKSFTLSTLALTGFALAANAQTMVTQDVNTTVIDFTTGTHIIQTLSTSAHAFLPTVKVIDNETTPILEKGSPDLGKYAYAVVLPSYGIPSVTVEEGSYTDYNDVYIAPSKGSLKRNVNPKDVSVAPGYMYTTDLSSSTFYPEQRAAIHEPFNLRSVRGASLHVYPYAYNASTHVLRVYDKLKITITNNMSEAGINPLLSTNQFENDLDPVYQNLFINYKQVKNQFRYTPIAEKGTMLIVTQPACTTAIQPLADWKKQRGINVDIVTTTTTGATDVAIASYISTYYSTHPNLMFVLLVGDHEQLPAYDAGSSGGETKWSDSKYGMLTGSDWYPEVLVGRMPAKTDVQCTDMVNKALEYEKMPAIGSWYTHSIGIGSDMGAGIGDDGEADWQHIRNIRTDLMTYGYTTVDEFYDNSHGGADAAGNPTNTMVAAAVNSGAGLFLYCGHGSLTTCVTSNYSVTDIQAATNYGMYPFVMSVACNNGTFPGGECLTEEFVRAKNTGGNTGAIGACGSSILMAWAEPMETEDEVSKILTGLSATGGLKYTLGGLFYNGQYSMLTNYPTTTGQEVMETWILFGDPSVMIRSKIPTSITGTSSGCFTNGTPYTVSATLEGADVAITQDGNLVASGVIASGSCDLNVDGAVSGTATLTISGYNQLPYTATLIACAGTNVNEIAPVVGIKVFPNPAADVIYIENGGGASYIITDALGQVVANGVYSSAINVEAFNRGMYFVKVKNGNEVQTVRFVKK